MAVIMTAVVCFSSEGSAVIEKGKCGENVNWSYDTATKELIISGSGDMDDTYFDYKYVDINSVVIKSGVTSIGDSAFMNLKELKFVEIEGETIKRIGKSAFSNCEDLLEINIPNSVLEIGEYAFSNCSMLKSINLPDGLKKIPMYAFWGTSLKKAVIPDSVTEIEKYAFYESLLEEVSLSKNLKRIGQEAFSVCNIIELDIPDSVEVIDDAAFSYCSELKRIKLPEELEAIPSELFRLCNKLVDVNIPITVKSIGAYAFAFCDSIEKIIIPHGVKYINEHTFHICSSLKEIFIPDSIKSISECAFILCENLSVVNYSGSKEQWDEIYITPSYNECITNANINYNYICKHIEKTLEGKTSDCNNVGLTEGKICSVCGKVTVAQKTIEKKSHTYKTTTTKATLKKNGKQVTKCTVCGDVKSSKTIYYPKSVKLSTSTYTYNGKTKAPTVVVKDSKGNTLKKDTDYTVKYASGRKNPGKYTVTVTFKGKYSGTKKLSFTIKPKAPSVTDIYSKTKGKAVIKWNNVAGESGYQLYYSTSKNGTYKKVKSYEANKLAGSKTKLKSGKTYYFKVRAYKKTSSGTVYSSWSAVKSVKVK